MNQAIGIITIISILTIVGMVIITSIIYSVEKDKRQLLAIEYWLANGAYFVAAYFTRNMSPVVISLGTLLWIWRIYSIRRILASVAEMPLRKDWHNILIIGPFLVSAFFAYQGYDFIYYTLPQSIGIFLVAMDCLYETSKNLNERKKTSAVHYLLFFTIFIIFAHILDYSFLRFSHTFAPIGFAVSLMNNILMAILLPSVTIYDLKHAERVKLEAQLLSQSKFSALGEMAAGIAHEINNPLGIISSRANYLRRHVIRETAEKDFIIKNLEQIEIMSDRMGKIITSLRKFSRDNRKEPFDTIELKVLIEDTLSYCHERFRLASVKLLVDPYPELQIKCRPIEVSQVLINLLNNSFDAVQGDKDSWVKISCKIIERNLRIIVEDSGPGIPAPIRHKIMDPFFTTKEMAGTGLGLSISKGIIEDHQGRLYYDESSTNTTFVVELPLDRA